MFHQILEKEVTQKEHTFIAGIIIFVLYQLVFHLYLKRRSIAKKNMQELSDIFDEYFQKRN